MPSQKIRLSDLIKEQLSFDKLVGQLDRNLFCLPSRVDYTTYLKGLTGVSFNETSLRRAIELKLPIDWSRLIPATWIELNPNILMQLETPVNLRTDFINDLIFKQTLVFHEPVCADIIFEIFSHNSMWDRIESPNGSPYCKSNDGKYSILMVAHQSEISFIDASIHIVLMYK